MKRRLVTLLIVGAMTVGAMAPATVFAATNGNVDVKYTSGVLVPEESLGTYYVTIPSSVSFTAQGATEDMQVGLHRNDVNTTLDTNLEVEVGVKSANAYKLKNTSYPDVEGVYTLEYATNANSTVADWGTEVDKETLANTSNGITTGIDGVILTAKLAPDTTLNNTNSNTESLVGYIDGQVTLTTAPPDVDVKGTEFKDTLTYYVRESQRTGSGGSAENNNNSTWG